MRTIPAIARAAAVAMLAVSAFAVDTSKLKPSGYVNDFANAMSPTSKVQLESYLGDVERSTGAQIAVVTIDTLDGEPIEDVANRLYHEWGIGKKGVDEGILILLAIKDRKQRAEIGKGLEGDINDAQAGDVLRGIRPILRQGNYGGALLAAAQQFGDKIAAAKGVDLQPQRRVRVGRSRPTQSIPFPLIVIGIFVLFWLFSRIGGGGGGGTGFLTGMILGNMMGRGRSGWGGGGGFGGGGDSGGGWGGFGGGDSGGGGASSDW
jgi:uncharacterized protein